MIKGSLNLWVKILKLGMDFMLSGDVWLTDHTLPFIIASLFSLIELVHLLNLGILLYSLHLKNGLIIGEIDFWNTERTSLDIVKYISFFSTESFYWKIQTIFVWSVVSMVVAINVGKKKYTFIEQFIQPTPF